MRQLFASLLLLPFAFFCSTVSLAQNAKPVLTGRIVETQRVTLEGNTTPAALHAENDRGPVADTMQFDHLLLALKTPPETEAALAKLPRHQQRR